MLKLALGGGPHLHDVIICSNVRSFQSVLSYTTYAIHLCPTGAVCSALYWGHVQCPTEAVCSALLGPCAAPYWGPVQLPTGAVCSVLLWTCAVPRRGRVDC